ncbi:MAG: hypothetical protein A2646_01595 [Candidatus Portnoybacteria bacterium RIFCSPHIGHO2_02_FULL_39_12]|uniref:Glycosyltransferase 2-like domain-containing protein n=1 Tax=Candidatus Portnoybacteria bacterium RIFCSPHIGHO2_12_FULL_38_9 TaxID=1801997 RepID=A0A1G2FGW7_9BACT|nr:MAG: hypothetical protein A3H00_03245 [Candidatus Portnoybacteria bacterium RBG_13_40_8]OGZ36118.1 MAG: hypothetical protein A2646_01595 [Candidatus Portnoybacteria bacterium RIFCSPHIGHO2_02_FULL_39_12]OGZ36838.1 MAG: hypothetical protein A3J64_02045 [Candidatus Portnoybacteria bacterium RIFCSPHIGHO2_12_FULL_38_9]OGZ38484.1 MAG: hypothetical protein A3F21_02340 [Candidatus Portnoybacteria bacterium RIFCSPLOWO2_01_FULL_38_39]
MPKVFIIILHWNNLADTLECLESLEKIDYPNYQVVVIDNGSSKKFPISNFQFPIKLEVIYNEENLGFAGGNNVGIKYALKQGADYVLLLNNDTVVDEEFLKELVKAGESDKKIGLLGSKIYFYDEPKRIWFAGGKISPFLIKGAHLGLNEIDNGQYNRIRNVDYITGCCLLIKRKAIEKIGLLDEDYFLYYEDADWSWRAQKAGYQCVFAPQAKIWHKCSRGAQEGSPSYIYYHLRNSLLLIQKNGSFFMRLNAYLMSFGIITKQIIKLIFLPKKRVWAKYILLGIRDFYLGKRGKI